MNYTYEQLVVKIARAKLRLEGRLHKHDERCDIFSPSHACSCGAASKNEPIEQVIAELYV